MKRHALISSSFFFSLLLSVAVLLFLANAQATEEGEVSSDVSLSARTTHALAANSNFVVTDVVPVANSHATPVTASIFITAAAGNVMISSVTTRTVRVHGAMQGWLVGDVNVNGQLIVYDPNEEYFAGELIETSVTTGVLDTNGDPLDAAHVWQFRARTAVSAGFFADRGDSLGNASSNSVALGDLDGDRDLDAVVANVGIGNTIWLNDGSGGFTTDPSNSLGNSESYDVALGDLDGDGDLDAFEANYFSNPNRIWLNDGAGSFTVTAQLLPSALSYAVALGDLDGDGDLDAVVANLGGASKVWLNDGDATFSAGANLAISSSYGVALGDIDGDGDLDAVFANYYGEANTVWSNDGHGVLTNSGQILGTGDSFAVSLGDVDNDGDLDAFVANWAQPNTVWINDATGVFTNSANSLGSATSIDVSLADVDGDGDLDALIANYGQANAVWVNDGGVQGGTLGQFSLSNSTLAAVGTHGLNSGDLDGDGDIDLFLATDGVGNRVLLNVPTVDLTISKSVTPTFAIPGNPITFTLTYANNGLDVAAGVVITDLIPSELDYNTLAVFSTDPTVTARSGQPFVWDVANLPSGAGGIITVTGILTAPMAARTFTNSATIAATTVDTNPGDNGSAVAITLVEAAPVANSDVFFMARGSVLSVPAPGVLANDNDPNGDALTAVLLTPPLTGTFDYQPSGAFTYTPVITFSGSDSFLYLAEEAVDLVAYWPFDSLTNPTPDTSGNGHDGLLIGGVSLGSDASPVSPITLDFDGVDDYIQAGGAEADFDFSAFSVAFWVKVDVFDTAWQALITKGDSSWQLSRYLSTGYIVFATTGLSNLSLVSTQPITDGGWHHLAAVYDGSHKSLYLDGVLDASVAVTGTLSQNNFPVQIGENAEATGRYFDGQMDDVRVYGEALSAADVSRLNAGLDVTLLSAPTMVVINVTPPLTVTELSPAANSHTATLTTSLTMGFNVPIMPGSVYSQSTIVHGGFHGRSSGDVSGTARAITYDPWQDFDPGELVQSTLLTDVLDVNGDPLSSAYVWQFQTAAGVGPAQFADSGNDFGSRWAFDNAVGDVDRDGDLDIVAVYSFSFIPWLNDGNGNFTFSNLYQFTNQYTSGSAVSLGDLDGDGDLDVFATLFSRPNEVWLNNGGTQGGTLGEFTRGAQLPGFDFSNDVALGDLDGDGDLDAFVANQGFPTFPDPSKVWVNDGSGGFVDSGQNLGNHNISAISLGDVDRDGDLDVFVSIYANPNQVWLNTGDGTFVDSGQALGTGYTTDVSLGDVDGDRDLDAFVSNIDSSNNKVWLNDGNGVYSDAGQKYGIGRGVGLADLDGDGDLDAIILDIGADRVLLNDGSGLFTDGGQNLGNSQSEGIVVGDADGDGDLDLFIANYYDSKVWLNTLSADLSIQKSAGSSAVSPGEIFTYTLTYLNAGPHTAVDVIITDTIPVSMSYSSLTVVSSGALITRRLGSTYVWDVVDLAPASGGVITITGVISNPLVAGSLLNQATIGSKTYEANGSNNQSGVTTIVSEVPPVALSDTFTTTEDTSLVIGAVSGVLQNDYDLNSNPLSAVLSTSPAAGMLQLQANGGFVYTPALNFAGVVTFSYQVAAAENVQLMAGYWALDDNATTAADNSGHGNEALLVDAFYYVTDPAGNWTTNTAATTFPNPYAYVLDGVDDYAVIYHDDILSYGADDDFSLAFWVQTGLTQTDVTAAENFILGKWHPNGYPYLVNYSNQTSGASDGHIQVSRSDGTNTPLMESTVAINDGQYHHVAFVKNGEMLSLYVDGVVNATITDTTSLPSVSNMSWLLFGVANTYTRFFGGLLDDVRLYERGLSPFEVEQLANGDNADQISQPAVVTIAITPVNDAPVALDDSYTVGEDSANASLTVINNDSDLDVGDTLSIKSVSIPDQGGAAVISGTILLYTPVSNFAGFETFDYVLLDSGGLTATATVSVTVTNANDQPTAVDDSYSVDEDSVDNLFDVLLNDFDVDIGDSLSVLSVTVPVHGTAVVSGTHILYSPDPDFFGTDSFFYVLSDGALTDMGAVQVEVKEGIKNRFFIYLPLAIKS